MNSPVQAALAAKDPNQGLRTVADLVGPYGAHDGHEEEVQSRLFAHEVAAETRKLRAREEARRLLKREQVGSQSELPPIKVGTDFLDEPDEVAEFRLDGLLPSGGRAFLNAQYKAGKSTMVGNLTRSLVDGDAFLDHFEVLTPARRVAILDDELSEAMMRRWLRDQGIQRTDGFATVSLRGRLSTFDILDPAVRRVWADALRALDIDVVILDCLRPILDALGIDENTDAGRFLVAFDELLAQAGASEAVVVHHMGHQGERARGSSRLRDWPDVEWNLVRSDPDDPASPRYFKAFGRDVEVSESLLEFDPDTRHLTLAGGTRAQHRKDAAARDVLPAVLELLDKAPEGLSGRQVEQALVPHAGTQKAVREALRVAHNEKLTIQFSGPKRAIMHTLRRA